jgi:hypothetical protein
MILRKCSLLFSNLCGPFDVAQDMLSVPSTRLRVCPECIEGTCFAGDIRVSCGSAALEPSRWLYTG